MSDKSKLKKPDFLEGELYANEKLYAKYLKSKCKICDGSGKVMFPGGGFKFCDCFHQVKSMEKYIFSNISQLHVGLNIEQLTGLEKGFFGKFKDIYENIAEIILHTNLNFCRRNDNSYGTTSCAVILMKRLVDFGYDSYSISFDQMLDLFFAWKDDDLSKQKQQYLDFVQKVHILHINDYGLGNASYTEGDFVSKKLFSFLNFRISKRLPLIISTDFTLKGFIDKASPTLRDLFSKSFVTLEVVSDASRDENAQRKDLFKRFPFLNTKPQATTKPSLDPKKVLKK